ncbi:PQQ-binding-like beta-propeller repeat protein [Actinomadura nitritigenes]|uniref:PQQ-binding-like beta-propeller repeat protein n=1 Tax=Actinomadura nitritigenes TaxID=134602 RepID=UPI00367C24DF
MEAHVHHRGRRTHHSGLGERRPVPVLDGRIRHDVLRILRRQALRVRRCGPPAVAISVRPLQRVSDVRAHRTARHGGHPLHRPQRARRQRHPPGARPRHRQAPLEFLPGGWLSPPAASGGHVAVSSTDHLHCLDAATGKERWRVRGDGAGFPGGPAIADGVVCAVDGRMHLAGLDVKTGRTRWHVSGGTGGSTGAAGLFQAPCSITSDGGAVYVHSPSGLWAVSARDGKVRWSGTTAGGLTRVVPSGPFVYAAGTGGVSAIAAGNAAWTVPAPHWASGGDRPLALADGALTFTTNGRVSNVDATSGAPRWTAAVKDFAGEDVPLSNAAAPARVVCVLAKDEAAADDTGNKHSPVDHLYAFPA